MQKKLLGTLTGAILVIGVLPARADTHAPTLQMMEFICDGQVSTWVSPGFNAKAGQDLGSTSAGVAYLITFGDETVYESPAFAHIPQDLLTTCTAGDFTFLLLVTPPR